MASLRLIVVITSAILTFTMTSCKDEATTGEIPAGAESLDTELPEGVTHVGTGMAPKVSGPAFKAQDGWTEVPPARSTRAAQFRVADGPIDVSVFAWQNDVGGLESNVANWIMASARERSSLTPEELSTFEVEGGYTVTTLFIEQEGAGSDPADGAHGPTGDAIFRAYIRKDGTENTWTLKADGPREAMLRQRPAFDAFVRSL